MQGRAFPENKADCNHEAFVKRGSTVGVHRVLWLAYLEFLVILELLAIAGFVFRVVSWALSELLPSFKAEPTTVCSEKGVAEM